MEVCNQLTLSSKFDRIWFILLTTPHEVLANYELQILGAHISERGGLDDASVQLQMLLWLDRVGPLCIVENRYLMHMIMLDAYVFHHVL